MDEASTSNEIKEVKIGDAVAHLIYQISIYFTLQNEIIGPKVKEE